MRYIEAYDLRIRNITDSMNSVVYHFHEGPQHLQQVGLDSIKAKQTTIKCACFVMPHIGSKYSSTMESLFEAYAWYQHATLGKYLYETFWAFYDVYHDEDLNCLLDAESLRAVQASATLFDIVSPKDIFGKTLDHFFDGNKDAVTLTTLKDEIEFFKGKSPFEDVGVPPVYVCGCFEDGIEENKCFDMEHVADAWVRVHQKGYSAIDLCKHYLVSKGDIHSHCRCSGVQSQLNGLFFWIIDYCAKCGTKKSVFRSIMRSFENHMRKTTTYLDSSIYLDALLELVTTSEEIASDALPIIKGS